MKGEGRGKKDEGWLWRGVAVLVVWMVAALVGCRQSPPTPTPTIPPTPPPDPTPILRQAGTAMQALQSVHWQIERTGGPAYLDDTQSLNLSKAAGDYAAPNATQATITALGPGVTLELQTIAIGSDQWVTNPLTLVWEKLPPGWGFNPAILFDPELGWEPLLREDVSDVRLLGVSEFGGITRYQIQAVFTGDRVRVLTGGLARDPALTTTIWIDPQTYHVIQLQFSSASPTGEPSQWQLNFSQFNADVNIVAPTP